MPFVNIGDINMHYRVFAVATGSELEAIDPGAPTMIVIHGGFGFIDHRLEVPAWASFSSHVQLVFIDQRGCGLTDDGDPALWTMDQFGVDIFSFANALRIVRPIVAGVSAGGYAAISYGTKYPGHARALILCDTEPKVSIEAKRDAFLALGSRADRAEFSAFRGLDDGGISQCAADAAKASVQYDLEPLVPGRFEDFSAKCFPLISKSVFQFIEPARVNSAMKKEFANGYQKFDYLGDMARITSPVLWLAGEWDPIHPPCGAEVGARLLAESGRDVVLRVFPTGDPVYQDRPDIFRAELITFFESKLGLSVAVKPSADVTLSPFQ